MVTGWVWECVLESHLCHVVTCKHSRRTSKSIECDRLPFAFGNFNHDSIKGKFVCKAIFCRLSRKKENQFRIADLILSWFAENKTLAKEKFF